MLKEMDVQFNVVTQEKENELKKAQCQIEETTTRVNTLAKQNGVLRAQNEQQKVQFNAKEQELRRQVSKAKKDLAQETNSSDKLKDKFVLLERNVAEKDRKLNIVSKDLMDKITGEEATNAALLEVRAQVTELKARSEQMESSNQTTISDLQKNIATMSEELGRMSSESNELHQENLRVNSLLKESNAEVETLKMKSKDAQDHHEVALQQAMSRHRDQMQENDRSREELQKQLSDSKQIIESTATELHSNRLTAVEREIKKREESEKQLLTKISELSAENKNLREQWGDSSAKTSIVENNLEQIQHCLFEATEKSSVLNSELQQSQKCNSDLRSQHESLSRELKDGDNKIQELTCTNERLNADCNTVITESQALRLQLSELQRSTQSKVAHLSKLNEQQEAEFDNENMKLEEQITDSNFLIQNLMKKLETNSNESSEAHEQRLAKVLDDLATMELDAKTLQSEKEHMQDLFETCENERNALAGDNEILAGRVAAVEAGTKRWMETSRLAAVDVCTLKEADQNSRSRVDRLQEMVDQVVIERDAFASELKELSNQSIADKDTLESELRRVEDGLSLAQNALNDHNPDDGALMRQIVELEDKLRDMNTDLEYQKENFSNKLSEQSSHHQKTLCEVRNTFAESVQEKESFVEKLQIEIEDKQAQIQNFLRERDDLSAELESSEDRESQRTMEIAASKSEVDALKKELKVLEGNARSSNTKCDEMVKQLQDHLRTAEEELEEQRSRSDDILNENSTSNQSRIGEMQKLFSQSVVEKEEFIEKLQEELELKQNSMDTLVSDHRLAIEEKDNLDLQLCEVQSHLKMIQNQLEISKREAAKQRDALRLAEHNSNSRTEQLQNMFKLSVSEKETFMEKLQQEIEEKQDAIYTLTQNQIVENEKNQSQLSEKQLRYETIQQELEMSKRELGKQREEMHRTLSESDTRSQLELEKMEVMYSSSVKEKDTMISTLWNEVESLEAAKCKLQDTERDTAAVSKSLSIELTKCQQDIVLMRKEHEVTVDSYHGKLQNASEELNEKLRVIEDFTNVREQLETSQNVFAESIVEKDTLVDQLKEAIEEKQVMIERLTEERQDVLLRAESLSSQLVEVQNRLEATSNDANDTFENLNGKSKELEEANITIASLKDSIRLNQIEVESMTSQINAMTDKISVAEMEYRNSREEHHRNVETMQRDFDILKSDNAKRIADLETSHSSEREEFSLNLDEANHTISTCKNQLVAVQEALTQKDQSIEIIQKDLESKGEELSALVKQKETEVMKLQDFSASLRKTIDDESLRNEALSKDIKRLESTLENTNCLNADLKEEVRDSEKDAASKDKSLRSLTSDIIKTCRDLKLKQNGSILTFEDSKDAASDLVRLLQEAVKDNQSNAMAGLELANSRERAVFRLERTLNAKERDIQGLQDNMSKLKSSVAEMKNRHFLTKSRNSELELNLELIENDKAEIENEHFLSEELVNSIRKEKLQLNFKIEALTAELKSSKVSMVRAQTTINEYEVKLMILGQAREQVNAQSSLITQLQSDLDDVLPETESLIMQNESLEEWVQKAEEKIKSTESSEVSAREQCSEISRQLTESVAEVSSLQTKNNHLYNENSSLFEKLGDCQSRIDEMKVDFSSKENEMLKEMTTYESNVHAQKRIATVLEKHLRARSDEIHRERKLKDAEIADLRKKLELKYEEDQVLSGQIEEAESKLEIASTEKKELESSILDTNIQLKKKDELISQLHERFRASEINADTLQTNLDKKDAELTQVSDHMQELLRKESQHQAEHYELLEKVQAKSIEIEELKSQISSLNGALTTSHKNLEESSRKIDSEKDRFDEKFNEIENAYQDTKARLFGAEKLATIHDKECTRLLNDIESKSERISSLTEVVQTLETDRDEANSKMNTLKASLAAQIEIVVTLEVELSNRSSELEDLGSNNVHYASDVKNLNGKIMSLEVKLEDQETEMEILLCQSKDDAINLSDLQRRLDASEEETQLLCEGIEEKDSELSHLHETVERIRGEKTETLSLLTQLQGRLKNEMQQSNAMHLDCLHDDDGISLGISRPSLSPTASDIAQKHSELLDDLVKMKSAIYDAISPSKSMQDETSLSEETAGPIVAMLQEELQEKNCILKQMGDQVDSLMEDIAEAKNLLNEKEVFVEELTTSLKEVENNKSELKKKLRSRKSYTKQLEDALSHEVKHRRDTEGMFNVAMEEKRALATAFRTKSNELSLAQKRVEEKSHAVEEQMKVARQLAKQLHTTKQKIFALKQHLQKEGLLKDGNLSSIPHNSPILGKPSQEFSNIPGINAVMSNDSINWNVSEDDYST